MHSGGGVAAGIEAMNVYGGMAVLDVMSLAKYRQLDTARFENLLMLEKTVALPCEDPVSFAVNAARPIVDGLSSEEKNRIEMVVSCTESGLDFGKSLSTYIHHYLGLNRNCRLFELKNACYSGVAGLQTAVQFVLSRTSPGAKALVVATDVSRMSPRSGDSASGADGSYAEPSSGSGAVAILVGESPAVFRIDVGANGYYGYEVCDTCRPIPNGEMGHPDLSLMSYLDCLENAYAEYARRVEGADYRSTFQYLAFHTPFGGMVKGAHRTMLRKIVGIGPGEIEADFDRRVMPGLRYCQRVGNIMGATALLSLASAIDNGSFDVPKRIGCFSYGSGCCSEFFSGTVTAEGQSRLRKMEIAAHLDSRHPLTMEQYESLLRESGAAAFGVRDAQLDWRWPELLADASRGKPRLYLKQIRDYHREYEWVG